MGVLYLRRGGAMGFARRIRRSGRMRNLFDAAMGDPKFVEAMEFDRGAINLDVGAMPVCQVDEAELYCIRSIGMDIWAGEQLQYVCPLCNAKYVQFLPKIEVAN